uniref:Uncharacterized protein n=1 Tax=Lepeophtheirus salmonis TaxID=72036 RepID=A0A0K2T2X3_LEPSM
MSVRVEEPNVLRNTPFNIHSFLFFSVALYIKNMETNFFGRTRWM